MKTVHLGRCDYAPVFEEMKRFNDERTADTEDELWVVEHNPVFTQGLAGKPEHLLIRDDIPVVQIDRGGQITYHGPGQLVVYTMIDFKRRKTSVRNIVSALENSIIDTLSDYGITANADPQRPGVYVQGKNRLPRPTDKKRLGLSRPGPQYRHGPEPFHPHQPLRLRRFGNDTNRRTTSALLRPSAK